jgi:DNA-binding NtrC family response regulator
MSRPRVLLLEPEAVLVSILVQFFELEGIEVTPCESVMELKSRLARDPMRVVVAESWMSFGGEEVCRAAHKAIAALSLTAAGVILTTGCARAAHAFPKSSERVCVIPKPYELDDLAETIRAMWARARRMRQTRARWRVTSRRRGVCAANVTRGNKT